MIINCAFCNKEFKTFPQRIRIGKGKFCSRKCGCMFHGNRIKKICLACRKEFIAKPSADRKYCSYKCYRKHFIVPKGEKHHFWKGDKIGYWGVHVWIRRTLGTPKVCQNCGSKTAKKFEWANISGKYRRDISDWKRLCTKCHIAFDKSR